MRHQAEAEFLEGETAAGKTTVGALKFMLKVLQMPDRLHFIASKAVGDAEKNIIQSDLGLAEIFGQELVYMGNGSANYKIPHLLIRDKVVFILGYSDRTKWEKALGSQFGCGYIDEINTADMDFVREATMRCKYWMATLNPDDPNLPVYKEYINRARPLEKYSADTPNEIREMLVEPMHPKWTYWFFGMEHNAGLSEERKEQIRNAVPKGTKIYKNKILGLRGRSTGLVFPTFDRKKHTVSVAEARKQEFSRFIVGMDTSYSQRSDDTIAMILIGLTNIGTAYVLDELVLNNKDVLNPITPSELAKKWHRFVDQAKQNWGFARTTYIDNADVATRLEIAKYIKRNGLVYDVQPSNKKIKIIDRIQIQNGWLNDGQFYIVETCKNYIQELELYSWKEDKDMPEDRNDHCINAGQYAWAPIRAEIGRGQRNIKDNYSALMAGLK